MNDNHESAALPLADVSFGFVLLPNVGFRRELSAASNAITARMHNANIVDEARFPAHLSLYLGGTTVLGIEKLGAVLNP